MDGNLSPLWFQKRIFCKTLFKDSKSYSYFDCYSLLLVPHYQGISESCFLKWLRSSELWGVPLYQWWAWIFPFISGSCESFIYLCEEDRNILALRLISLFRSIALTLEKTWLVAIQAGKGLPRMLNYVSMCRWSLWWKYSDVTFHL